MRDWGYETMSVAMTDVMMADLPRVEYRKEKPYTKKEEKMICDVQKAREEQIKKGGLMSSLGVKMNLDKAKSAKEISQLHK